MELFNLACLGADVFFKSSYRLPAPDTEFSLIQYLADILTDPVDRQHLMIHVYSKSGKGKSYVAARISQELAKELSRRSGKPPEYYFDVSHVVIMNKLKSNQLIAQYTRKENQILMIDEAVDDSFSRESMKKTNRNDVKFAAVSRVYRMCIIRCCQRPEFLDKGVRDQSTHEIIISRAEHKRGYNEVKFKIMGDKPAGGGERPGYFPTSEDGRTKYHRFRIGAPSPEFLAEYETTKLDSTDVFVADTMNETVKEAEKTARKPRRDSVNLWCMSAWQYHLDNPKWSMSKCIMEAGGGSRETFGKWLNENGKEKWYATAKQPPRS